MRRKRRKKRIAQMTIMFFSMLTMAIVVLLAYMDRKPMVAQAVTVEAGTPSVDVDKFMLAEDKTGSFVTDMASLNMDVPGEYEIQIRINKKIYSSLLEVIDTTAPTAEPVEVIALKDEQVEASQFVTNVMDVTDVKISFVQEPDLSTSGEKEVKIALEDTSHNIKIIESKLTVLNVKGSIQVEAGTVINLKPEDFVDNSNIKVRILSDLSVLDISSPRVHSIEIEVDGRILNSNIEVVDTTPPVVIAKNVKAWKGDTVMASDFVDRISDISSVNLSFSQSPDFEKSGSQEVIVIAEDEYGNRTQITSTLTITADTEPPVFYGIKDKIVYEGDAVSYKKGVSVKDNRDTDVSFQVDSSKVNLGKEGTYTVYYTAKDAAGNKTTESAAITVQKLVVSDELLNEKVDGILAKIVKDSMTKREKAYEIYKWVKSHVAYTGSSDKSDWKKEAYRGIVNGLGDCFTYYAVSEAFLTRAGIDNMRVTRVGGRTQHFWNLIDCGDGWYHFDTCPNKDKKETFMLTDKEVEAYTKQRGNNYYSFDKSLYPATPEE